MKAFGYIALLIVVVGLLVLIRMPTTTPAEVRNSLPSSKPVAACAAAYVLPLLAIGFVTVKETAPPLASNVSPCAIWTAVLILVVGLGLAIADIERKGP